MSSATKQVHGLPAPSSSSNWPVRIVSVEEIRAIRDPVKRMVAETNIKMGKWAYRDQKASSLSSTRTS